MKFTVILLLLFVTSLVYLSNYCQAVPQSPLIWGFHFHTYYFQSSQKDIVNEFYKLVSSEINPDGQLTNCAINHLNLSPIGPHPIGSFETCCNATALPNAIGFFMKHRGVLPILLHPLTTSEVIDHTERAMWMGPKVPLDLTPLAFKLHETPHCPSTY